MKAIGFRRALPIDEPMSLEELDVPTPQPQSRDLLVRVSAVSVNPVDTKVRRNMPPPEGEVKVLGWDAVGTVEAVGAGVLSFKPGDRVYYAGSLDRAGANSELHLVDERIAAIAPEALDDAAVAALPLTAITAWELLFDRFSVPKGGGAGKSILIVGGAGGVGSILIQLARQLTGLTVIATASRQETRDWCLSLGAHAVIDHSQPLSQALKSTGIESVDYVAALTESARHFEELIECLRPQGALGMIDDPGPVDIMKLKRKSLSFHWEFMFTRPLFGTEDMDQQGRLLAEIAALVDSGHVKTTLGAHFGRIDAANLRRAHAAIESGRTRGKIVLQGF